MENASPSVLITIAGPSHDMPHWPEYATIDALMASLTRGEEVWLYAEPDNPYDPHAIECWLRGRRAGYVKATEAPAVQALLHEGILMAKVDHTDCHKTYWVLADNPQGVALSDDILPSPTLPESLLPPGLHLEERPEERQFDILCARMFAAMERGDVPSLLAAMETYEATEGTSFCREEMMAWHRFEHRLEPFLADPSVQAQPDYPRMRELFDKVAGRHHDYCSNGVPLRLYNQLMKRAEEGADDAEGLLTQFWERALAQDNNRDHLCATRDAFASWLDKATEGTFSATLLKGNASGFARRLYYAAHPRRDLLTLAAHILVWQRLYRDTFTLPLPEPDKTPEQLSREDQIRAFMHRLDPFVVKAFKPRVDMIIDKFVSLSSTLTREVRRRTYPYSERVDEELIPEIGDFSYNAIAEVLGEMVQLGLYHGRFSHMGDALGVNTNIRNHLSKGLERRCPQTYNIIYTLNEYATNRYPLAPGKKGR